MKGYHTIEAALLYPIILQISILFIYLLLFSYNKIVLQRVIYTEMESIRQDNPQETHSVLEELLIDRIEKEAAQAMIGEQDMEYTIEINLTKISICAIGQMDFPFRLGNNFIFLFHYETVFNNLHGLNWLKF